MAHPGHTERMSEHALFSRLRQGPPPPPPGRSRPSGVLPEDLEDLFSDCGDFERREVLAGGEESRPVRVFWLDGLTSGKDVSEDVLRPLTQPGRFAGAGHLQEAIRAGGVWACACRLRDTAEETAADLLRGCCALVFPAGGQAVTFEVKSQDKRAVSQPTVEKTLKGAKDAFTEVLRVNTTLIRRRLRTPDAKLVQTTVGRRSGTDVAVLYIDGIADPSLVAQVRRRLDAIDVDGLTAAGNLEQYITDRPRSLFPQLLHTERPDRFAAELLAGRVGLLADGLPLGFLLPGTLVAFLRVAEDRGQNWAVASLLLLLRWLSLGVSLLLPALFTAMAVYHPEMIPTRLLLSMVEAKQSVPFALETELLAMLLAFELLMEAGLRLPDPVGDTVSIIGGLIVGQSAVEAKIVSPVSLIVVAAAAICGFTQPSRDLGAALRLLRFGLVLLASALGLVGVMAGAAGLVWYLCTMDVFGRSYLAPLTEGGLREVLRALLRLPLPAEKYRERALRTRDRRAQA